MITEFNKFNDENLLEIISDTIMDYVDIWNNEKSIDWTSAVFTATEITNLLNPIKQLKNLETNEISNIINDNLEVIGGGITIDSIEKTSKKIFDYLNNIIVNLDEKWKILKKIDTYNL